MESRYAHENFKDCDEIDFEDALSDGEDDVSCGLHVFLRLPGSVPTGGSILAAIRIAQAAFQSGGSAAVPLNQAIVQCRDTMAKEVPPFYAFCRLLAKDQQHAIASIFGVCHAFEHCTTKAEVDLQRRHLRRAFNSDLPGDGLNSEWGAIRAVLGRYALVRQPFEDYADGIIARPKPGFAFNTMEDMLTYAYREAGAVGLMALPVLADPGVLDAHVVTAAISLGIAVKLVDMVNCIGMHYRTMGCCWIPLESLRKHNITGFELQQNLKQNSSSLVGDRRFQNLMTELLDYVGPLLNCASQGGEKLSRGGCLAVRVAVRMCRRVVARIEARQYNTIGEHENMFTVEVLGDMAKSVWSSGENCSEAANTAIVGQRGILQLPASVPTGGSILDAIRIAQAAFQSEAIAAVPLNQAIVQCRDTMAKEVPPFYAFCRLLAKDQQHAIASIFGVCHAFEQCKTIAEVDLQRRHLRRAFNSDLPGDGLNSEWGAIRAVLGRYALVRQPFEDYADGIISRPKPGFAFNTMEDMLTYAYREAGVVGLMALPVLADPAVLDAHVVDAAISLGIAVKIVDMLNCIGMHFRKMGYCWIPLEFLRKHSITRFELQENLKQNSSSLVGDERFQNLMAELLGYVGPLLSRASQGGEKLSRGGCLAVRVAVRMCRRVVAKIEARQYNTIGEHEKMFSVEVLGDMAKSVWSSGEECDKAANAVVVGDGSLQQFLASPL